jgi:hypothetical protein
MIDSAQKNRAGDSTVEADESLLDPAKHSSWSILSLGCKKPKGGSIEPSIRI